MSIFKLELIPAQHDKATIAQSSSIHVYCVLSSVETDASYSSVLFLSCLTLPRHSSTIMMNRILIFSCEFPSNSSLEDIIVPCTKIAETKQ